MTGDSAAGDLRAEAVRVLTAAAHRLRADGTPCDFADFLAGVLAATSANLGGVEQLLAGRPGSWEAALVRSLVAGTIGDDPGTLWRARTEPLIVPLNVAEMLEGLDLHPGLLTVEEALEACDRRRHGDDPQEATVAAAEAAAIEVRYRREFAAYAERFAAEPPAGWVGSGIREAVDTWNEIVSDHLGGLRLANAARNPAEATKKARSSWCAGQLLHP
jgi:hypothetical protein